MKRALSLALLSYFRWWAKLQLKKTNPTIIGITGSAGKTSALQACQAVLTNHFALKVSHKANSESGIPLNILGLHLTTYSVWEWLLLTIHAPLQVLTYWPSYQIYLVEMGIDGPTEPKNMTYLLKIIQPNVGIFLNVAPTHAEPFDQLIQDTNNKDRRQKVVKLIAQEKGKLITSLPEAGTAVLNADDPLILELKKQTSATVLTFGKSSDSDIQIIQYSSDIERTLCELKYNGEHAKILINGYILPKSYAYTFAASIACGISQNLSFIQAIESLKKNFTLPPGRSSLIPALNNSYILDSTYNASTAPMLDMLELLQKTPTKRKLALLGDMRELGEVTQIEHETVAQAAAKICDAVFLVGPHMKKFAMPIIEKSHTQVFWFRNAYEAADHLRSYLKKGDMLLVKASQNTLLLEIAVEKLMSNPEDADTLLCRRGKFWDEHRKAILLQKYYEPQ